jgi:hypothetical protein
MTYYDGDGEHEDKFQWLNVRAEFRAYDHLRNAYEADPLVCAARAIPFYEAIARAKVMYYVLTRGDPEVWVNFFMPLHEVEYDEYERNHALFKMCYDRFRDAEPILYCPSSTTHFDKFLIAVQKYCMYHEGLVTRDELEKHGFRYARPIEESMNRLTLKAYAEEMQRE